MPRHLEVLYRDQQLLLIHKPSGMPCHRSKECNERITLIFRLREQLQADAFLVHRLDRGTSGVMVLGTTRENAALLSRAFREKQVEKTYLALVRGWPDDSFCQTSEIDDKPAHSDFVTLERVELPWANKRYPSTRLALLRATPRTGLRHQLRRHLRRSGYPILGDREHGDKEYNRLLSEHCGVRRLLLHAHSLKLPHPTDDRSVTGVAALPGRLRGMLDRLGFSEQLVASLRNASVEPR